MEKEVLNKKEQKEITTDVKQALEEASLNEPEVNLKKKTSQKISIIVSVLVIIVVALGCLNFYLANNPRTIFFTSIEKFFSSLSDDLDQHPDYYEGEIVVKNNSSQETYSYTYDKNSKVLKAFNNQNKIDFYINNGSIYVHNPNVSDSYIFINNSSGNILNAKEAVKSLNTSLHKILANQKFTLDKKAKNKQAILQLNDDAATKLADNLLSELTKTQTFINFYNALAKDDGAFISDLNNLKQNLTIKTEYTNKHQGVVKIEIINDNLKLNFMKNKQEYKLVKNDKLIYQINISNNLIKTISEKEGQEIESTITIVKTNTKKDMDNPKTIKMSDLSIDKQNQLKSKLAESILLKGIIK